jgi:hypothetical protein
MEICEEDTGPETISRFFTLHVAVLLFFGLGLALEIPLFLKVLTPEEFWVTNLIPFLGVIAAVLSCCYYHLIFGMLYAEVTHKLSIIHIVTAILSIIVNIVLIKAFGLLGAFLAALIVQLVQCLMAYRVSGKYYFIPFEWRKILLMSVSMVLIFFLFDQLSFTGLGITRFIDKYFLPLIISICHLINLDQFQDGRIISLLDKKLPFVFEGIIKGISSFLFLISLFAFRVISIEEARKIFASIPFLRRLRKNKYPDKAAALIKTQTIS